MIDLNSEDDLREAVELMYFAYRGFTAHADKTLAARSLNRVHHRLLYFIGRDPEQTVGDLIKTLAVSKQALNARLRQLIEMGLVRSAPDADDRRLKRLALTARGARLEATLTGAQITLLSEAFKSSGTTKADGWRDVMATLSASAKSRKKE
ncbi:MAG: MarR family transcriptional regulator [Pseudomonadota bacterium]